MTLLYILATLLSLASAGLLFAATYDPAASVLGELSPEQRRYQPRHHLKGATT